MSSKIRIMNHTGDTILATYDTDNAESVEVAQEELTKFLEDCIAKLGYEPPVWGRRAGQEGFLPLDELSLDQCEEILCQPTPLVGG